VVKLSKAEQIVLDNTRKIAEKELIADVTRIRNSKNSLYRCVCRVVGWLVVGGWWVDASPSRVSLSSFRILTLHTVLDLPWAATVC